MAGFFGVFFSFLRGVRTTPVQVERWVTTYVCLVLRGDGNRVFFLGLFLEVNCLCLCFCIRVRHLAYRRLTWNFETQLCLHLLHRFVFLVLVGAGLPSLQWEASFFNFFIEEVEVCTSDVQHA
jgi:hypothetical protein